MNETEREVQGERPAPDDNPKFDANHIGIEEGDCIFMAMVHLVSGDTSGISASDWPRPPEWVWVS
jgi:hypothetical protein